MEKTSLKFVFFFTISVIAICSSLVGAREMAKEEVNCLFGKCADGKKNREAPIMDSYETDVSCRRDNECIKYCPKGFKIVNCNFGTCFCER
ncbi:putative defensin-like protein 263 [Raphanus sativus]|uniref:Defensin-like protein 263 n=1 Tax=Raphanus sativus TaxID=3726 RepID=A0A6J0MAX5_RAPSA|nr:putative defensin-like protein 263 [Raphanus sativus]